MVHAPANEGVNVDVYTVSLDFTSGVRDPFVTVMSFVVNVPIFIASLDVKVNNKVLSFVVDGLETLLPLVPPTAEIIIVGTVISCFHLKSGVAILPFRAASVYTPAPTVIMHCPPSFDGVNVAVYTVDETEVKFASVPFSTVILSISKLVVGSLDVKVNTTVVSFVVVSFEIELPLGPPTPEIVIVGDMLSNVQLNILDAVLPRSPYALTCVYLFCSTLIGHAAEVLGVNVAV